MVLNQQFLGRSLPEIPTYPSMEGWKEFSINYSDEPLVPLGVFAGDYKEAYKPYSRIFTDSIYAQQHTSTSPYEGGLDGSLLTCFVRQGIADRLLAAQSHLPEKHAFVVWDTFRTLDVQQALFDDYRDQLVEKRGMSMEEATEFAQKYVSIPSADPTCPSPHNTGASVDLSIVKFSDKGWAQLQALEGRLNSDDWKVVYKAEMEWLRLYREETKPLNMGTVFDEMTDKVSTRFYEEQQAQGELTNMEREILMNRRLLVDVMGKVGFSNYPEEWFHFDFGNQFHMSRTGEPAVYGAAVFSGDNQKHERMRREHLHGSEILRNQGKLLDQFGTLVQQHPLAPLVQQVAKETGDMRQVTRHDSASKLVA